VEVNEHDFDLRVVAFGVETVDKTCFAVCEDCFACRASTIPDITVLHYHRVLADEEISVDTWSFPEKKKRRECQNDGR